MSNRESLLECALDLFARRGYDAVGVREICDAVRVTKPTLYHYFGSKRGLLATLMEERYAPFVSGLARTAAYSGDLPATLEGVVDAYFGFAEAEPVLCRLLLTLWAGSPEGEAVQVVAPLNAEQERLLEGLFARAARDDGNMRGRQRIYAVTLLGMVRTYVGLALGGEIELNGLVVHRAVHQFSHGIYS